MKVKIIEDDPKIIPDFKNHRRESITIAQKEILKRNKKRRKSKNTNFGEYDFSFDKSENRLDVKIQLFYNGEPATNEFTAFYASFVPGNLNEIGAPASYNILNIDSNADSIISLSFPDINQDVLFSKHINGLSYSNFAIFGTRETIATDDSSKKPEMNMPATLFLKGKIYRTDVTGDAENGESE